MKKRRICIAIFSMIFLYNFVFQGKCCAENLPENSLSYNKIKAKKNLIILIDINQKTLFVVSDDKILKKYPIATGKPDTPSPLGDFQIIVKDKWGKGFGSAWFGLDVPWGKYGIHGTNHPESIGRSASHGCIRMFNRHINELYNIVDIGTPVKIVGGIYGLFGNEFRTLAPGDRGADVLMVQKKLKEKGYYTGSLDGIYGIEVERALNRFQKANGLVITNKIGPKLYKNLGIILFE